MELVAGVDEVGRGPLAGPVVAAAVILDNKVVIEGLNDSKKLSEKKRELLFEKINQTAQIGIGVVQAEEIEKINILNATHKAMKKALGSLRKIPEKVLIDGYGLPDQFIPNEGIIKGDETVDCIMAASIVAKVTRDRLMNQYDIIFPEYGFKQHKGYGTPQHLKQLEIHKASLIHRKTFSPVKEFLPTIKWLQENRLIGPWGERLAALKYLSSGYKIISMNYNCPPLGEIDIIAESESEIIFAEVKTSAGKTLGSVEEQVNLTKLNRLNGAIKSYLTQYEINKDIRLDVFAVTISKNGPSVKHYSGLMLE